VQLLLLLIASTAIPFFVISSTAPLVQSWFSRSRHASSEDPYFLYSASNAGSLLALLVYPFLIEPRFGVIAQTRLWAAGYLLLCVLLFLTVGAVRGAQARAERERDSAKPQKQRAASTDDRARSHNEVSRAVIDRSYSN